MNVESLAEVARGLTPVGKGILAADESSGTIEKRFNTIGVISTEENRRAYRELLFTAPGMERYISGVILFDETIKQSTRGGVLFPDLLTQKGVKPGIKVDQGLEPLGENGEKVTKGLEGLPERLAEYAALGAVFTKWRAVINIGNGAPTDAAIARNAEGLAKYAAFSQAAGLVPIVEPEVLMDGDHSIKMCREVSIATLTKVFASLKDHDVDLSGMLLKPSMVLPGKNSPDQVDDEEIARQTIEVLLATVPRSVPGIVFLSGGQNPQEATRRLNAMNRMFRDKVPWQLSFSYGRALQEPVLRAWVGKPENVIAAQKAFIKRAWLNSSARFGMYKPGMEG
ncbi:MAG: fructose-bisphosphate aldolase class I [Candidatus Beckwithbacteria bacterium]|nr:fructose-bisphosphate aldolase class I [Candidatus Beckwithbacteria bacterium]